MNRMSTKVCGNCNIKHASAELSGPQHLCKECRRTLPQEKCSFCQIDFYVIGDINKSKPACKKCSEYYNKFGDPKACDWCKTPSAFKGSKCFQCKSAEEKYGKPSRCEGCKKNSYFDKGPEAKKKVENKALCLLCTLKFKKELHRSGKFKRSSAEIVNSKSSKSKRPRDSNDASSSAHRACKKGPPKEMGVQVDLCGHSSVEDKSSSDKDNSMEAMLLTTQLKEEIAQLKRQLDARDRELIVKGKELSEKKTDMWELEKKLQKKITDLGQEHIKRIEGMEQIIRDVKAHNSVLVKKLKTGTRKLAAPSIAASLLMDTEETDST